jgi:hypothetical protein
VACRLLRIEGEHRDAAVRIARQRSEDDERRLQRDVFEHNRGAADAAAAGL